ncbi:hypothetical protein [Neobacillus drentensis]
MKVYEPTGVKGYWIVDNRTETVEVYIFKESGYYQLQELYVKGKI